jgi:hypothetical protein
VDAGLIIAARIDAAMQSFNADDQKSRGSRAQLDENTRTDPNHANNAPIQDKGFRTADNETVVRPLGLEPRNENE